MTKLASNSPVTFVIHKRFAISVTAVSPLTIRDLSEISGGRGGGVETEGGSQLFEIAEKGGVMKNGRLKGGVSCKYVSVIM